VRDYLAEENQQNGTKLNSKNRQTRRGTYTAAGDGRRVVVLYRGSTDTPAATPDSPDPLADFTGLWSGTSTSTVNAAKVKVSFDVKREGHELNGIYRYAPLNAVCRNNDQRGWMHGSISARGFTVSMEDTSWCAFMLDEFYPAVGDGGYTCYIDGSIADQGTFEIKGPPSHSEATLSEKPRS
jgi:hypothetical protein